MYGGPYLGIGSEGLNELFPGLVANVNVAPVFSEVVALPRLHLIPLQKN